VPGRRDQPHRHRRRLLRRPVRGDPRRGADRPQGPGARRHQGADADGRRPERRRPFPPARHLRLRGEPAPPRHRPHRPVPGARVGRQDPARGDARGARPADPAGQGALRRCLQLRLLAADEGPRHRGKARPAAVRQPADLLLAAGPRGGVRTGAARGRPGPRDPGLEPAGGRPAVRQVPQGPAAPGRIAGPHRLERAAGLRSGAPVRHHRGADRRRPAARRLGRPGRAGLHTGQARRHLAGHRRAHDRATGRQPCRRVAAADRFRARRARQGQRAAADLPLLAPGQDRPRPPVPGRPHPARPLPAVTVSIHDDKGASSLPAAAISARTCSASGMPSAA
jgi:hypothetical protein